MYDPYLQLFASSSNSTSSFTLCYTSLQSQCYQLRVQRSRWRFEVCFTICFGRSIEPSVLTSLLAKPTSALLPYLRTGPSAFISSTSSKSATTDVTPSQHAEGPPLSVTGKPRREVPLPSQEKKEGAMQYALYVIICIFSHWACNPPFNSRKSLGCQFCVESQG